MSLSSRNWFGFEIHERPTHLAHLLRPLGWSHETVEFLHERIRETQAMGTPDSLSLGLNAPGPYELITHPNRDHFSFPLTIHKQPASALTHETATSLCPIVGGNSFGPDNAEELCAIYRTQVQISHNVGHPISYSFASMSDLLVWGDGSWLIYGKVCAPSARFLMERP